MNINEVKEQLQEDILSILDGFDIIDVMDEDDFEDLKTELCNSVINNLNKLDQ